MDVREAAPDLPIGDDLPLVRSTYSLSIASVMRIGALGFQDHRQEGPFYALAGMPLHENPLGASQAPLRPWRRTTSALALRLQGTKYTFCTL